MATPSLKFGIELNGEKEFRDAVGEIDKSLKVLRSEMRLVAVQFDDNADSLDALTESNDVLNRQILTQKEKIEMLQAALKNAATRYGEADERTKKWQTDLN